ncbi:ABC transporter permease [Pseudophaeobacter sp. EL27]|uniref:ABC transporter permease n=1 Tax=Pseudophaeobacter sp. EL27 TaxID=2107580 RepID=UPI000EFA79FC|nr:ABC transporter permease subunit [Pseudophaeobacter sp. EL27]
MEWHLFKDFIPKLLAGVPITLGLLAGALALGVLLGAILCYLRVAKVPVLRHGAVCYVSLFRGTPMLVQLFAIYFGLGQFEAVRESIAWPLLRHAWFCAFLTLGLNSAAFTSEILRGGLLGLEKGQLEAAKAYGFSRWKKLRFVILPQLTRISIPAYSNEIILVLKGTSLASTISLLEITGLAKQLSSKHFTPFEAFISAGVVYLAIVFALTFLMQWVERRLDH